ncbi:MAG: carboxylate-amine ligase [Alphaproteobacteria bacterium]|nr:carboxylate-amine ligase [Alphaproteobacteria bacterium]
MADAGDGYTLGIEEEYLLVDPETRDLAKDPAAAVLADCEAQIASELGTVSPEFLKPQIEIGTSVCANLNEARSRLTQLRRIVGDVAESHGYRIIAASTHPSADWHEIDHTDKDRYNTLAADMQTVARRLLICGMHVHVGIEDDEHRIDVMNQVSYFLPHLLALSTSSPFWQGQNTGLLSYRLSVFDELPRTGLPERFDSWGEYARHVDMLVDAELVEDASKIWWDARASAKFPTVEMRITDICTTLDDALSIAAIFVCLVAMIMRLRRSNQRWRVYSNMLINENRWRAQRYGLSQGLVDFGKGEVVDYAELLEEILELVGPDAAVLGCLSDVEHARTILERGTSAHRQLAVYETARKGGADPMEAHRAVVDWLIEETMAGVR